MNQMKRIFYLRIVMQIKAEIAPENTLSLGCFMLNTAAMKNVLSPISVAMIIMVELVKALRKPELESFSSCIFSDALELEEGKR